MTWSSQYLVLLVIAATNAASLNKEKDSAKIPFAENGNKLNDDLKTASSSYSHQYSNWGGNSPGGYGYSITGYGTIDDKINTNPAYRGFDGYDNSLKSNVLGGYNNLGYSDVGLRGTDGAYKGYGGNIQGGFGSKLGPIDGYNPTTYPGGYSAGGYGTHGYSGSGYGASGGPSGYGATGLGANGFGAGASGFGASGYGASGYGASGYGASGYDISALAPGGYEGKGLIGNGGYGGYGGNGGLASYSGYNNPLYKGAGHLGYGYYNKGGYGNIYSSGVTPNLVTGYRGYTRR